MTDAHGSPSREYAFLSALRASNLRTMPSEVVDTLADRIIVTSVAAGEVVRHEGESAPHLYLVASGLIRVFVAAPDGRTMTVRYVRRGGVLGAVSLFAAPFVLPATLQAVTNASVFTLPTRMVRHAADHDVRVARVVIDELAERVLSFIPEIASGAFATVRQRVARHILDLASDSQQGLSLRAEIRQQELADAVGSVREVVVRVLRDLREDGLIRTGRDGVVVLDAERLAVEAYTGSAAHGSSGRWNTGS